MEELPLVSVLMTVYNRERYISEAIESVITSTYQNWELIVVDDQSKDRSVEIAQSYGAKDSRISVFINEKNMGDYPNRNKAASYAKGKYLKYVDADDMLYPHGLEIMVKYMENYPEAALGLCRPDNDLKPFPYVLYPVEAMTVHYDKSLFTNAPTSTIIRTKYFNKVGGFSGKQYFGDTELWLRLGSQFPTLIIMRGLTWWRSHDDQQIKKEVLEIEPIINRHKLNIQFINEFTGFSYEQIYKYTNRINHMFARNILSISFQTKSFKPLISALKNTDIRAKTYLKALITRPI